MKVQIQNANIELDDPTVELQHTLDDPTNQTFMPTIVLIDSVNREIRIGHVMPPQPYVKGTWSDEDVAAAIAKYINEIKID